MLTALTEAVAAAGDLDRALDVAALIVIGSRREFAIARAAQAAAARGEVARAETVARAELRSYWLTCVLLSVAVSVAAHNPRRAGELLRDAEEQADAGTLAAVADAYVAVGDLDRARAVLDRIEPGEDVLEVELVAAAEALAAVGDLDRAVRLIGTFEDDQHRCAALSAIALASGDARLAERLADEITALADSTPEPYWPAQAHLMAAEIHRRGGAAEQMHASLRQAEAFARGITNDHARSGALVAVAQFEIAIGRLDHAEAIGRSVPDPGRSARVLAALAEAAPPGRVPHLVGAALLAGPWPAFVDLLAARHPSIVAAIADEVLASARARTV